MRRYCTGSFETVYDGQYGAIPLQDAPEGDGRVVCPFCGRSVRLRRHPGGSLGTMQVPRHYRKETVNA